MHLADMWIELGTGLAEGAESVGNSLWDKGVGLWDSLAGNEATASGAAGQGAGIDPGAFAVDGEAAGELDAFVGTEPEELAGRKKRRRRQYSAIKDNPELQAMIAKYKQQQK